MRKEFSQGMERLALADERIIFITGDLGFNALENLQEKLGPRFINAGVAEQNMVGMAAGMAARGFKVFCYSIAPFVVYRCLEQFRVDACLHQLPVFLVGNGGGYGYGIMGSTHHAIEDLAALSSLQNVTCYVPAFSDEVEPSLEAIVAAGQPAYLRLGVSRPTPPEARREGDFLIVRQVPKPLGTVVALGPLVVNVLTALQENDLTDRYNVLTPLTLPLRPSPAVLQLLAESPQVLVAEEHTAVGGLGQQLAGALLEAGLPPRRFGSLHAKGYPGGLYGDQAYHQQQSGLDPAHIARTLREWNAA